MRKVLIGIASFLALLVVISYLLPKQIFVLRTKLISAPASQILPYITSVKNWPRWSEWNRRDPDMKITYGAITEGQGASWSWKSESQGDGKMTLILVQPDTVSMVLDLGGEASSGFRFAPSGNSTLVTWTMACDAGFNPIMRFMGLMLDSMVGEDYDKGLENLKALAERGPVSAQ